MEIINALKRGLSIHTLITLICWGIPLAIFIADLSRTPADAETWQRVGDQVQSLLFDVNIWMILTAPIICGLAMEIPRLLSRPMDRIKTFLRTGA